MVKSNKKLALLIKKKEKQNELNKTNQHFKNAMDALGKMEFEEETPNAFEDPEGFQNFFNKNSETSNSLNNNILGGGKTGFEIGQNLDSDSDTDSELPTTEFQDIQDINKPSYHGEGLKKNKSKIIGRAARRRKNALKTRSEGYVNKLEERALKVLVKEIAVENRKRIKMRRRMQK